MFYPPCNRRWYYINLHVHALIFNWNNPVISADIIKSCSNKKFEYFETLLNYVLWCYAIRIDSEWCKFKLFCSLLHPIRVDIFYITLLITSRHSFWLLYGYMWFYVVVKVRLKKFLILKTLHDRGSFIYNCFIHLHLVRNQFFTNCFEIHSKWTSKPGFSLCLFLLQK